MTAKKRAAIKALESTLGVVTEALKLCGISRATFYRWKEEDEVFRAAVEAVNDIQVDFAENSLMTLIAEGSVPATIFFLKTKGKSRGYNEKIEQEISLTVNESDAREQLTEALSKMQPRRANSGN